MLMHTEDYNCVINVVESRYQIIFFYTLYLYPFTTMNFMILKKLYRINIILFIYIVDILQHTIKKRTVEGRLAELKH